MIGMQLKRKNHKQTKKNYTKEKNTNQQMNVGLFYFFMMKTSYFEKCLTAAIFCYCQAKKLATITTPLMNATVNSSWRLTICDSPKTAKAMLQEGNRLSILFVQSKLTESRTGLEKLLLCELGLRCRGYTLLVKI